MILAHLIGPAVRRRWAIENSLHWVMDVLFRDNECRVRTNHPPANFTTIKHRTHNLLRKAPGKSSLRSSRKAAAWDDNFPASLVTA
jgi:predicted transposase YbfD/YdcC